MELDTTKILNIVQDPNIIVNMLDQEKIEKYILENIDENVKKNIIIKENMKNSIIRTIIFSLIRMSKYLITKFIFTAKSEAIKSYSKYNSLFYTITVYGSEAYMLYRNKYRKGLLNYRDFKAQLIKNLISTFTSAVVFSLNFSFVTQFLPMGLGGLPAKFLIEKFLPAFLTTFLSNFAIETLLDKIFGYEAKEKLFKVLESKEVYQYALKLLGNDGEMSNEELEAKRQEFERQCSESQEQSQNVQKEEVKKKYKAAFNILLKKNCPENKP
jgi:hypothetical protein